MNKLIHIAYFFTYGAEDETRTRTAFATRPSNVRGYQLRHLGWKIKLESKNYLLALALAEFALTSAG